MKMVYGELTLRSATASDIPQLVSWWSDGKVMEHAGFPHGLKTDVAKLKGELNLQNSNQHPNLCRMVIEYQGRLIGEMSYRYKDAEADIGIKICDFSQQNQGLGPQCLTLLINYLFEIEKVQKIVLSTMLENKRAQHVYEKLGFQQTKIDKDCWVDQVGRSRTAVCYELLPSLWHPAFE